jgi:hypothetical protein
MSQLPFDRSLHFRCALELSTNQDLQQSWGELVRDIRSWIKGKLPEDKSDFLITKWFFLGGEDGPYRMPRFRVKTERFLGSGHDSLPQYWACRFDHPCTEVSSRQWRTDIGLTVTSPDTLVLSLSVIHWLPPGFIGSPAEPTPSSPRIVGRLLSSPHWQVCAGTELLRTKPVLVGNSAAQMLVNRLADSSRKCPIVYISMDLESGKHLLDPFLASRVLAGTASVYMAESNWVDQVLEGLLPYEFRCWNGNVRVYQSGVKFNSSADARRHRYFQKWEIQELGAASVQDQLVTGIVRRSYFPRSAGVTNVEEVKDRKDEDRFRQLLKSAKEGQDAKELIELYQQEIDKLNSDLKKKADELEALEEVADAYATYEEDASRYRYERDKALEGVQQAEQCAIELGKELKVFRELKAFPDTVPTVLELIERLYPDRVFFTEKAKRSARDASLKNPNIAWECLRAMAVTLHDMYFQKQLSLREIAAQFRSQTGFELAVAESETTKRNKNLAKKRTDNYKGETIDTSTHVKHGNAPGNNLRVHFFAEAKEKKLIIGHCGDHLDTVRTN